MSVASTSGNHAYIYHLSSWMCMPWAKAHSLSLFSYGNTLIPGLGVSLIEIRLGCYIQAPRASQALPCPLPAAQRRAPRAADAARRALAPGRDGGCAGFLRGVPPWQLSLEGSFSAVSKPIVATKHAVKLCSIFQDLQDLPMFFLFCFLKF